MTTLCQPCNSRDQTGCTDSCVRQDVIGGQDAEWVIICQCPHLPTLDEVQMSMDDAVAEGLMETNADGEFRMTDAGKRHVEGMLSGSSSGQEGDE